MANLQPEMLDQIHCKIQQLESAINRISRTKKQLKENALMAKDGIHTTISRHLETLRNREVWLLGQVDLLEHAKEDLMRQQQAELNQAIGGLKNALELMDDQNLLNQLQEVLQRVETLKLSPDETPYLTFRADPLSLREAIQEYGQVDTRSLPIQRAFVSHESSSTSLPRAFEDYEDADHHMLYKTVHGLQNDTVQVSFPRLAKDVWLYRSQQTSRPPVRPASIPSYLDKLSTDASIKNWLYQLKHEGDMEEDHDFEMVHSVSNSSGSESLPSPGCVFKHLTSIANSPLSAWLKQSVSPTYPFDVLRYFQHLSNDTNDWLVNCENGKPRQQSDQVMSENQDSTEWLKKPGYQQVANPEPFHTPADAATWLLSKKPTSECTKWLIGSTVSTETEYETSKSEPAPLFEYFQKISNDPSTWLKKASNPEQNSAPLFDYFCKISDDPSMWLKPTAGGASDSGIFPENLAVEIGGLSPYDLADWVVPVSNPAETNSLESQKLFFDSFFQHLNHQTWLRQSDPLQHKTMGGMPPTEFTPPFSSDGDEVTDMSSCASSPVVIYMEDSDLLNTWLHPSRRQCQLSCDFMPTDTVV